LKAKASNFPTTLSVTSKQQISHVARDKEATGEEAYENQDNYQD
jgi:hypothetical protein